MKCLRLVSQQEIAVQEIPEPEILAPDEVKVRVVYVSICADETMQFSHFKSPIIPGHEFSGVVCQVGEEAAASGLAVGDRVTGYTWLFCGKCHFCRRGQENLCINNSFQGAMREYLVLKDRQVCKVPHSLSLQKACLFEPTSACIHGLDCVNMDIGSSVLIIGGGGAGMLLLQLAKRAGASLVVVSEPMRHKQELCLQLGADEVVNPYTESLTLRGLELTDDFGFDCIIDASRNEEAVHEAIPLVSRGGTMLLFSMYGTSGRINLSLPLLYNGEITLRTSFMAPHLMERTLQILPRLNLDVLMSTPFTMEQGQQAFEMAYSSKLPRVFIQIGPEE